MRISRKVRLCFVKVVSAGFDKYLQLIGEPPADRPKNISALPISAKVSNIVPVKSYDEPENKFQEFNKLNPHSIFRPPPEHCLRYVGPRMKSSGPPPRVVSVPKVYIPPSSVTLSAAGRMLANRSCKLSLLQIKDFTSM